MFTVNKKISFGILFMVFAVSFAMLSCKSTGIASSRENSASAPSWVLNPSVMYNSALYITNVGTGRDRDAAQTNALSGVASFFGQNVNSTMTSTETVSQTNTTYEHNRQVEQNILREVRQNEMLGVSVDNYWFDGDSTWYAIAVINRMDAASLYESRITSNNSEISRLLTFAENDANKNTLAAYARYNSAANLAADNDVYITRLSVLNSLNGEVMRNKSVSGVTIRNKMHEFLGNIPIAVKISGDNDGTINAACTQVFSNQGFATAALMNENFKPRYMYDAAYQKESTPNSANTIIYCRYSLIGYITDSETGQRILPLSVSGREGASYQAEAERRAVASVKKTIESEFNKQFAAYLDELH